MSAEHGAADATQDRIEAVEALHNSGDADLHFRFIGTAKGREFVLNVQFSNDPGETKEAMRPAEYDFMIGKILGLVLKHMAQTPNPALH